MICILDYKFYRHLMLRNKYSQEQLIKNVHVHRLNKPEYSLNEKISRNKILLRLKDIQDNLIHIYVLHILRLFPKVNN
jgi:hypothetical protein